LQEAILDSNIIRGNSSKHGGGVWIVNTVLATLTNNVITNNTANILGAGIYLSWGDSLIYNFSVINKTISQNVTNGEGGGIYIELMHETNVANIYNNIIMNNIGNAGKDLFFNNDPNNYTIPCGNLNLYNNNFDQSSTGTFIQVPFVIDPINLDNLDPIFIDSEDNDFHLTANSPPHRQRLQFCA
jgi:hypothetical protein